MAVRSRFQTLLRRTAGTGVDDALVPRPSIGGAIGSGNRRASQFGAGGLVAQPEDRARCRPLTGLCLAESAASGEEGRGRVIGPDHDLNIARCRMFGAYIPPYSSDDVGAVCHAGRIDRESRIECEWRRPRHAGVSCRSSWRRRWRHGRLRVRGRRFRRLAACGNGQRRDHNH